VDRLPEPIQYEHGMFEYGIHHLSQPIASKLAKPARWATEKASEKKTDFRANPTGANNTVYLKLRTC
jgi:hypothetical protein